MPMFEIVIINLLKTGLEYTWTGGYGKCILKQNQIVIKFQTSIKGTG